MPGDKLQPQKDLMLNLSELKKDMKHSKKEFKTKSFNQTYLLYNIEEYLRYKKINEILERSNKKSPKSEDLKLPESNSIFFAKSGGYCAGLTPVFLHALFLSLYIPKGQEPRDDIDWWNNVIDLIFSNKEKSKAQNDEIDRFIGHIEYFQNIFKYSNNLQQNNFAAIAESSLSLSGFVIINGDEGASQSSSSAHQVVVRTQDNQYHCNMMVNGKTVATWCFPKEKMTQFDPDIVKKHAKLIPKTALNLVGEFTPKDVEHVLREVIKEGQIVLISGISHVIGVIRHNGVYHYYDANNDEPLVINDVKELASQIATSLLKKSNLLRIRASSFGDVPSQEVQNEKVTELLKKYSYPWLTNNPLLCASAEGSLSSVKHYMQENKALLDILDPTTGHNSLHATVAANHIDIADYLLKTAWLGYINTQDSKGNTAVHIAIECNKSAISLLLSRQELDLSLRNATGCTPLFLAVTNNEFDIVKVLLQRSDAEKFLNMEDQNGVTPFQQAVLMKNHILVKEFLKFGSLRNWDLINYQNKNGDTALHVAVSMGDLPMISELVKQDQIKLDQRNKSERNPLDLVLEKNDLKYLNDFINLLKQVKRVPLDYIKTILLQAVLQLRAGNGIKKEAAGKFLEDLEGVQNVHEANMFIKKFKSSYHPGLFKRFYSNSLSQAFKVNKIFLDHAKSLLAIDNSNSVIEYKTHSKNSSIKQKHK